MPLYRSVEVFTIEEVVDPMVGDLIVVTGSESGMVSAILSPEVFATQYQELAENV